MLNQVVLVGRISSIIPKEMSDGKKVAQVVVSCQRAYKNEEGEYETDLITIYLFNGIAENTMEYCKVGDIIGVKGRIESYMNGMKVIADKVSFLSSKSGDGE